MDEVVSADSSGRFSVELEEPATSGYSWTPITLPPGVQLEGDEVTAGGPALGGVRRHVFHFVASQAGRHKLDFELRRPWEEQAAGSRQVQVQVGA
jgi:predicted secreted protein